MPVSPSIALRPHDRIRPFAPSAPHLRGVCNLETHLGRYFVAYGDTGGIRVKRSEFTTPPFSISLLVTSNPVDSDPCLLLRRSGGVEPERLRLLFERTGQIYALESDDGGETWGTEMALTGGKHPRGRYAKDGERLEIAVVASGADNILQGSIQYPGDASASAAFTLVDTAGAALLVEDDSFDIHPAVEPEERMVLEVRIKGESAPSTWASAAYDYSTWERVT